MDFIIEIITLTRLKLVRVRLRLIIYSKINFRILRNFKTSLLLYQFRGFFTLILSKNRIAISGIRSYRIRRTTRQNYTTKFIIPIRIIHYLNRPRSIIIATISLYVQSNSNQSYLENQSRQLLIICLVNSSANSSGIKDRYISLIVTLLSCNIELINQYFLFFFSIIN